MFFVLLAHRWTIKPLAILLTLLSAAATYFVSKYDVAIDRVMVLNTVHTDGVEVRQLLSFGMFPYVLFLVVVPVALILCVRITFRPSGRYLAGSLATVLVASLVCAACLYVGFNAIVRAGNVSNKYIVYSLVPVNVISGIIGATTHALGPLLASGSPKIDPSAVSTPGDLVVVLAVGESSRRKNFGIYGYQRRDTTPRLRELDGLRTLDGIARAAPPSMRCRRSWKRRGSS